MATQIPFHPKMQAELRRKRWAMASASPEVFALTYLPAHCSLPLSRMHKEVLAKLARMVDRRDGRLAIAAPRGHAKSTIVSLAYVLWCALYNKEKLILIVSATKDQAILLLKSVKDELQGNQLLLEDFPEACKPKGARGQPQPWRDDRILLRNGAMILAYGTGQGLRGAKHGIDRPGLIIADDIEDPEQVIFEEQRQKSREWFSCTLLHAGRPGTNVIVVGTVLHHDSLLANLIDAKSSPGWTGLKYRAVESPSDRPALWERWASIFREQEEFEDRTGDAAAAEFYKANQDEMLEGTKVLWPEREDYRALMVMREREGQASFQTEKQNEPIDPEACIFAEQNIRYWGDDYADEQALLDATGRNGYFYGACDPSLGRRTGRGDYTAIVLLYQQAEPTINYVIAADISRRTPDQAIELIVHYAGMYPFTAFAVETNHFQELMIENLQRRVIEANVPLWLLPITNRSNKQTRIASLEPEVSQGRLRFCRRHHLLLDQLRQFPMALHDDGPDALEMAMQASRHQPIPEGSNAISCRREVW